MVFQSVIELGARNSCQVARSRAPPRERCCPNRIRDVFTGQTLVDSTINFEIIFFERDVIMRQLLFGFLVLFATQASAQAAGNAASVLKNTPDKDPLVADLQARYMAARKPTQDEMLKPYKGCIEASAEPGSKEQGFYPNHEVRLTKAEGYVVTDWNTVVLPKDNEWVGEWGGNTEIWYYRVDPSRGSLLIEVAEPAHDGFQPTPQHAKAVSSPHALIGYKACGGGGAGASGTSCSTCYNTYTYGTVVYYAVYRDGEFLGRIGPFDEYMACNDARDRDDRCRMTYKPN